MLPLFKAGSRIKHRKAFSRRLAVRQVEQLAASNRNTHHLQRDTLYEARIQCLFMLHRVHHGQTIKRLREIRGIKQEALALEMGEDWNQRKVSVLEGKEQVEADVLERVAAALGVTADCIENFCESTVVQALTRSVPEAVLPPIATLLLEKLLEQINENKALYERLVQAEREKTALLQERKR